MRSDMTKDVTDEPRHPNSGTDPLTGFKTFDYHTARDERVCSPAHLEPGFLKGSANGRIRFDEERAGAGGGARRMARQLRIECAGGMC
jgi:hypothetical protein